MQIIGLPRDGQTAAAFAAAHGLRLPRSVVTQLEVRGEISEFKRQQAEARSVEQARARHRAAARTVVPAGSVARASAPTPRMDLRAERQRLERVEAELRADIRRGNEQLVQEHERAAQATARHERVTRTLYGTPQSRAQARTEIGIAQQVEKKRLEYLAAEARAWARKHGDR